MRVKGERKRFFFTLTELMVVIIIIAILTVIAFPTFRKAVKHSRDKEAKSMLRLIAQSEEMYKLESEGYYVDCADTGSCNTTLDLSIAHGSSAGWDYKVSKTNPPSATFTAKAIRTSDKISDHCFQIKDGQDDPTQIVCP